MTVSEIELAALQISNDLLGDGTALRRRLAAEGYVFLRGVIARDKIMALRAEIADVLMRAGWLEPGSNPLDGIAHLAAQCTEGDPEYTDVYHRIYSLESFHRSGHWPEVLAIMGQVVGGEVLPHPQKIARLWFPQYTDHTTPRHQDFVHFQGSFETYTFWSPVGDCARELGGLAVLPGSHKVGQVFEHHFSLGAGGLVVDGGDLDGIWHSADYEAGDVLIFPSLTVHQALPNTTANRLRISLDNRYQARHLPIAQHMLEPHLQGFSAFSWEQCYAEWRSDDLQYYWQDLDLDVVPQSTEWSDKGFAEALDLAIRGDDRALYQLRRIARRDPKSERGQRALGLLTRVD